MNESQSAIWFVGDLTDTWVASIADAIPPSYDVVRFDPAVVPSLDSRLAVDRPPRLILVHRQSLAPVDSDRFKEWRSWKGPAGSIALILCVGPYVRYEELERFSGLVDLVLSEATAADVLPRHLARLLDGRSGRAPRGENDPAVRILVASASAELSQTIAEACGAAGYPVEQADDHEVGKLSRFGDEHSRPGETLLTVWDVPVLEEWNERLKFHTRNAGPAIALMGFPDRNMVILARASGAIACLELPLNLDDLMDVIERFVCSLRSDGRMAAPRAEPPHALPPRPRRRAAASRTGAAQAVGMTRHEPGRVARPEAEA